MPRKQTVNQVIIQNEHFHNALTDIYIIDSLSIDTNLTLVFKNVSNCCLQSIKYKSYHSNLYYYEIRYIMLVFIIVSGK